MALLKKKLEMYFVPEEASQPSEVMSGSWWWHLGRLMLLPPPLRLFLFLTPAQVKHLGVALFERQSGQERPRAWEASQVLLP